MRSTKFLRGIHSAIVSQLQVKESIHILYAGCGPYATLLTPLISLFDPNQIQFTLLDIEPFSIEKVKALYTEWDLNHYVEEFRLADATDQELSFESHFDIIVSETMQVALRNEHQVTITRNLMKFLANDGVFVPERIALEAYMTETIDVLAPKSAKKMYLGTAFDFNTRNLPAKDNIVTLNIAENELEYLRLFTKIHLFEDTVLTERESGLTLPIVLDRFTKRKPQLVKFRYEEGKRPELKYEYEF